MTEFLVLIGPCSYWRSVGYVHNSAMPTTQGAHPISYAEGVSHRSPGQTQASPTSLSAALGLLAKQHSAEQGALNIMITYSRPKHDEAAGMIFGLDNNELKWNRDSSADE